MSTGLRLLHVHSGNLYGGVESMLATLVRFSDKRLQSSFALCFQDRFSEELNGLGSRIDSLGPVRVSRPWTIWRSRRRLAAVLREHAPDFTLFHSGWSHALFGPVAQRARARIVRWFHGVPSANWLDRWARRTPPDLAVCNSQFTAAGVEQSGVRVPRIIVHPPVAAPPPVSAAARERLRAALGVAEGTAVILQAGRMEPGKGHRVMLEALARLKDRPGWVAWQVGGAQREAERSYVGELGISAARLGIADRVRFLGERNDVRELMAAADIYCQPNIAPESFGITFIEALYAELPVVTSNIGGANEIVSASCGVLTSPGGEAELADALRRLLADPSVRRSLGAAGPARAVALCDPAAGIRELESALTRMKP